jgi:phosphatidylinositol glycan class H protein
LTLPLRLLLYSTFLLRIVLCLSALLLLFITFQSSPYGIPLSNFELPQPFTSGELIWYILAVIQTSRLGIAFAHFASLIPLPLLLPVSASVGYATILRLHTEESLLVLRGLGIQTSTSSSTYLSTSSTRFIPTEKIQDILVNEAFRGFEVRYYLVVIVEGEEEVVVVFPKLLPRRKIVEEVWRGVRGCLYEPGKKKEERS